MSDYKKMMGLNPSKKITKQKSEPKKINEVLNSLKEEFGDLDEALPAALAGIARGALAVGKGAAKAAGGVAKGMAKTAAAAAGQSFGDKAADKLFSQKDDEEEEEELKEGPAYEYKKQHKSVEKSLKNLSKDYLNFYELLRKKGLDDEAGDFLDNYKKNIVDFSKKYKKLFSKLM